MGKGDGDGDGLLEGREGSVLKNRKSCTWGFFLITYHPCIE